MQEVNVDLDAGRMRFLAAGRGRPLLLCHGFLSSAEEFGGRFRQLADHRRLIIPDLPGNGGSSPLDGRHTAEALATALDSLLARLRIRELDVAGLCLGASVACALARRSGDRIDRLLLHTPLIAPALIRPFYRAQIRVATVPPIWRAVVSLSRNRTVSNLYKRFVIVEGNVDERTADANFTNQVRADPAAAREWLRDGMYNHGLTALLDRTRSTLVVVPEHDHVVDAARLRRLIANNASIRLVVDGAQGHGWNTEAVQRQLGLMQEFFAAEAA